MMKIYLLWFSVLFTVLCTVQNMTQILQYHCCNQAKTYSTWLKNVNNKNITSNNQRIIWQAHLLGCILLHIAFVPIMIFHLNLFFYQLLTTGKLCVHIFVPNSLQNGHFQFCSSYTCHIVPCRYPHFNLCTMKLFFSSFIKMF